jgi:hypothetical protein
VLCFSHTHQHDGMPHSTTTHHAEPEQMAHLVAFLHVLLKIVHVDRVVGVQRARDAWFGCLCHWVVWLMLKAPFDGCIFTPRLELKPVPVRGRVMRVRMMRERERGGGVKRERHSIQIIASGVLGSPAETVL